MKDSVSSVLLRRTSDRDLFLHKEDLLRQGMLRLLAIKDSDIRILTLEQSRDAVDQGLHAGGAFSATIPLVALYYGGFLRLDIEDPTDEASPRSRSGASPCLLCTPHSPASTWRP